MTNAPWAGWKYDDDDDDDDKFYDFKQITIHLGVGVYVNVSEGNWLSS